MFGQQKNGLIGCLGFPIHSTFLGVSIPIPKHKTASKDSFVIFLKPTTTRGGGRYKPCSIDSTPAGRGSGPLRPISAMELQAEQVINAFRLLISLTEKERKTVFFLTKRNWQTLRTRKQRNYSCFSMVRKTWPVSVS